MSVFCFVKTSGNQACHFSVTAFFTNKKLGYRTESVRFSVSFLAPIPPVQLETLAADIVEWREVCDEGLAAFDINYDQEADARRARRHTVTGVPATGPRCHICGRVCASNFGLRRHLRCHRPSLIS